MTLVEVDGCIFDKQQLALSHGFDDLDPVARETLVNHIHLDGDDRQAVADRFIRSWAAEMCSRWPDRTFRILRGPNKMTIRCTSSDVEKVSYQEEYTHGETPIARRALGTD